MNRWVFLVVLLAGGEGSPKRHLLPSYPQFAQDVYTQK